MPQDGIYRAILWTLALSVMAGAVFAILGETVADSPAMVRVGAGVALVSGAIYAFFRRLEAKERAPREAPDDQDDAEDHSEDGGPTGGSP